MAQIEGGGKGRRKTIDLNIVPFIDLMSVLITFLLIAAVWTQVSMIQIGTSIYAKRTNDDPLIPPPDANVVLRIDVKADGYFMVIGKETIKIGLRDGEYDDPSLFSQLEKAKQTYPNKTDGSVQMSDDLPYERLIVVMDTILKAGFTSIAVLPGSPK